MKKYMRLNTGCYFFACKICKHFSKQYNLKHEPTDDHRTAISKQPAEVIQKEINKLKEGLFS